LAESEERYSAVVENSTDGIVIIQDGVLKFVNSASVELVGSTPDGMIGTNFLEFVAPKSRKIVSKRYADRMAGKEVPNIYEISLLRKDGSFLPVEVNAELIEYEGRPADLVFIRNITERKRYQKELRLSEERYRRIVETAPDGIVTVDKEGNVTSCNKAFAELTGYSKQEVVGKHFSEIPTLQWIDNPGYANILSCVARGKVPKPFEVKWVHKDGTERFAEIRVSVLRMGKSVLVFQAIARDITDRRRAEQAVRESEEKFRSLADHSPNMIFINKMGRIVYANNKCEEILGYKKKELYSQDFDFTRLVAPESEDTVRSSFESCMKGEEVRPYEYTIVTKNGERIEAILAAKLIKYGGTSAILGVVTDITERKRAEEAIRRSEERYRLLAENVADFIWTTDMIGRFTYVSPSIENLLGYSVDEALSAKWKDYMTPESISIVIETLERELATEDTRGKRGHNSVTLELELIRRDGLKVWTETEATFLRNDCGEPMGILGVSRDITDRKHAEEALRKSEERYRLLAENVADVIWTTDMNLRFTYITPSVKHLMGYSVEEATALGFEDFIVPSSLEKAMNALRRRISAKNVEENSYGGVTLDLEFARKDGSTVWTQTEITFLSNEDGQPIGLLGATRDITEHKRIVSDLERANE
ncbi:MAG: PAS domain S-box protein, partial [Thermoplasmata archaeon]